MTLQILEKVLTAPYTSWQVGGVAEFFCIPTNIDELKEAIQWAHQNKKAIHILGGGSNVLISDDGIDGLTICLKKFSKTEVQEINGRLEITALSGSSKSELLKIFLKYKLAPALFLAGIPGDVGGGVVMNAGVAEAFEPREFVEIVDWVEVMDLQTFQIKKLLKSDLQWSYRHCHGWQPGVIVRVGISWKLEPDPQILELVKNANKTRLSKQPLDMPSCGSVFKNPPGYKAAQLIDQNGLKGWTIGGAQVSPKHANFIVNLGQASASDIWKIIEHVKNEVKNKTGVELTTEVVRLGKW